MKTSRSNQKPKDPASNPNPTQIRAAREATGLTQTQAAQTIQKTMRAWQDWEAGKRRMHPVLFEVFLNKTSQNK